MSGNSPSLVDISSSGFFVEKSNSSVFICGDIKLSPVTIDNISNPHEFSKQMKGILIDVKSDCINITNDPFCSIPIYFYRKENLYYVTTEPYDFSVENDVEIDRAGVWETILFGSCIWDRTIYKKLFQFPSASELVIKKEGVKLARYWDFNIEEDSSLKDETSVITALDKKLCSIFRAIPDRKYLMGISGGLDSRLTAAYLKKVNKAHLVDTFTYCSMPKSLDYLLAKEVCSNYGLKEPELCVLDEMSYRSKINFLPKYTCGQIGIQHSHICSILAVDRENTDCIQLSNYFSDALFGFDCSGTKDISYNNISLKSVLNNIPDLESGIRTSIECDIDKLFAKFNSASNYSSLDEFKYVTERNQKFHMNLVFQQSRFMDTCSPYANFELLEFMMSIPLHIRKRKKILDLLFETGIVENFQTGDISSRHFIAGNEFSNQGLATIFKKIDFKLQNVLSAFTAKITRGKIVYPNKYHTESHVNILHRFF